MHPSDKQALIAVDLGAQSCRVSLLRWQDDLPVIELAHRFKNGPVTGTPGLCWNMDAILDGVITGLEICGDKAQEGIASIAIDGWAVDYVRLDREGQIAAPPFCYRDPRTEIAETAVHRILPPAELYELTGIQILRINTLYQLYADKLAGHDATLRWLNLPEYIIYKLTGKPVSEYTNATHTGMIRLGTRQWCTDIFERLDLSLSAAPAIVPCGSVVGSLTHQIGRRPQFRNTRVVAAACHDTASAIAGIPAEGQDWAYISSGTWSLVGTILDAPCVSAAARTNNFTNLGGAGGKFCFLKNVNGLWLLQQCMEEWNQHGLQWSLQDLLRACSQQASPDAIIDIDAPELMVPGQISTKINQQLIRLGQTRLEISRDDNICVANLIFHSMAVRYAQVLNSIREVTGKKLKRLFIVGGGSQNALLTRLTAERSGLEVIVGSPESTTLGNFAIQLATLDGHGLGASGPESVSIAKWAEKLAGSFSMMANDRDAD